MGPASKRRRHGSRGARRWILAATAVVLVAGAVAGCPGSLDNPGRFKVDAGTGGSAGYGSGGASTSSAGGASAGGHAQGGAGGRAQGGAGGSAGAGGAGGSTQDASAPDAG